MRLSITFKLSWASPDKFKSFKEWAFSLRTGTNFVLASNVDIVEKYIPAVKFKGLVVCGFSVDLLEILA